MSRRFRRTHILAIDPDGVSSYSLRLQQTCELMMKNRAAGEETLKTQVSNRLRLLDCVLTPASSCVDNTKVDIGSQCYMQAKVHDSAMITVEVGHETYSNVVNNSCPCLQVGLGFYVEFTLHEVI